MKALEELRSLGATVVMDDSVLPASFAHTAARVSTYPYGREGTDLFLKEFGPAEYRSSADYERVMGAPLGAPMIGTEPSKAEFEYGDIKIRQRTLETDPDARAQLLGSAPACAAGLPRHHGAAAPRRLRLSGEPDAAGR